MRDIFLSLSGEAGGGEAAARDASGAGDGSRQTAAQPALQQYNDKNLLTIVKGPAGLWRLFT